MKRLSIACADVGSVARRNFGWAICDVPARPRRDIDHGSIEAFGDAVAERLASGRSVALGFECPLFVPLREDPMRLTSARAGERNRSWSAGAGCGSLATGLVETAWVLARIRARVSPEPSVHFSWAAFRAATTPSLFIWEALVTREAKADSHHGDAGRAVEAFRRALPDPEAGNIVTETSVYSLAAAALLRVGWAIPVTMLRSACIVLPA